MDVQNVVLFSSVSNFGGIIIFLVPYILYPVKNIHPIVAGIFVTSSLLCTSSFAFHLDPKLNTPQHTLDIFFGWVVYIHMACAAAFSVASTLFSSFVSLRLDHAAKPDDRRVSGSHGKNYTSRVFVVGFFLVLWTVLATVVYNYHAIYRNQINLFLACGSIIYTTCFLSRSRRYVVNGYKWFWSAVDTVPLISIQAFLTVLQGELWINATSSAVNNIFHGYWHLGNAYIISVLTLFVVEELLEIDLTPCDARTNSKRALFWSFHVFLVVVSTTSGNNALVYGLVSSVQLVVAVIVTVFSAPNAHVIEGMESTKINHGRKKYVYTHRQRPVQGSQAISRPPCSPRTNTNYYGFLSRLPNIRMQVDVARQGKQTQKVNRPTQTPPV